MVNRIKTIHILIKNAQIEYRISLVNRKDNELLLDKVLSLLNKKVYRSLRITENFESKDLIAYIDIADKIDTNIITGSERYPREMIKLIYENIHLPENVYQNLKDYYTTLYELISLSINKVATQYGRLKLGSEIYRSKIVSSYINLSYIRAKFIAYKDDSVNIYPGQIQFFLQHKYNDNIHHLAYVKWYRPHNTRRFYLSLKDDNRCNIEIWQEKFYPESRDCILPVQRILGRFIKSTYKFRHGNGQQQVLVVIPINKCFNL